MGEQTLRPLTVKQIKNASIPQEGTFRIDNADVTQVSFVINTRKKAQH
jgi:replication factor A2